MIENNINNLPTIKQLLIIQVEQKRFLLDNNYCNFKKSSTSISKFSPKKDQMH